MPPVTPVTPLAGLPAGLLGVCLAGPTASGKSALALHLARQLAQQLPVEIISVDSAQVYKGMDIGTAKPSAEERAAVPHHLIDIIDPADSYSAARFASDATRLAAEIRARQRLPLLVGGTMLYFKALRDGISAMPSADAELRAQIDAEAAARGWPALHAELARVDPNTAARLAPRDAQRIQRALEVWRSSGRTLSSWHAQDTRSDSRAALANTQWPLLSLEPDARAWLHQRIQQRLQQMVQAGFLAEVQSLRDRPGLHLGLPSMRCVGYRQAWQALDAQQAGAAGGAAVPLRAGPASPQPEPAWVTEAVAATRQLAKRQLTWLRSIPSRTVLACEAPDLPQQASAWLAARLSAPG